MQITTVDYLQLKKVQPMFFIGPQNSVITVIANSEQKPAATHWSQHKLYDLDRLLKGKDLADAAVREEVHASILKNVCGN